MINRCQNRLAVKHSSLHDTAEWVAATAAAAGRTEALLAAETAEEEEVKRSSPTLPGLLLLLQVDE